MTVRPDRPGRDGGAIADDEELDPQPQPDEALGLQHYRADCQRDPGLFAQLHGRAFLILQRAGERRLNRPKRFQGTLVRDDPPAVARELDPSRYLVFPVRKSPRSTIDRFYSVGQTRNNDIVIRDATVSKSHAFFENAPDGDGLVLGERRRFHVVLGLSPVDSAVMAVRGSIVAEAKKQN